MTQRLQQMRARRNAGGKAFTLVELLVVIAILVVLMGIMFPVVTGMLGQGDVAKSASLVSQLGLAIEAYEGHISHAFGDRYKLPPIFQLAVGNVDS